MERMDSLRLLKRAMRSLPAGERSGRSSISALRFGLLASDGRNGEAAEAAVTSDSARETSSGKTT